MSDHTQKVTAIFQRLAGDRAEILKSTHHPADIAARIRQALAPWKTDPTLGDLPPNFDDVGFHLVDWNSDAAFLVALLLYPDEFTDEEIQDGVMTFLIHAPAHILEAARLGGFPARNFFAEEEE